MEVALRGPQGRMPLGNAVVTIGRLPENTMTIEDNRVSGHHAEIHPDNQSYVLIDRGSVNGTYINGLRIQPDKPVRLRIHDQIHIGGTILSVEGDGLQHTQMMQVPQQPFQTQQFWPQPYYPPQQGYLPGPASPYSRPVRQGVKIAAISFFAVAVLLDITLGVYGLQLAGLCGLMSFILMFFI